MRVTAPTAEAIHPGGPPAVKHQGVRAPEPRTTANGEVAIVAFIGFLVCGALALWWFLPLASGPVDPQPASQHGKLLVSVYDPPTRPVEEALGRTDGQVFAGMSTDPLARTPEIVRGSAEEQAYRYQRPAYAWIGWVGSGGGHPGPAPFALAAATAVAAGLLVGAGARFLADRHADPRWALLLLLVPGVFIDLTWIGPEVLGTALAVFGLVWWTREPSGDDAADRRALVLAVVMFAAAGLCRETFLLIPFVLMVTALVHRQIGRAVAAALAAAPYVAWVLYLRIAIGAWPTGSVGGRLSPIPFGGMVQALDAWHPAEFAVAVVILVPAAWALVVGRRSGLRPLVAANLAFAAVLGEPVWHRFPDFSRVLLPLSTLSVLAIVSGLVLNAQAARAATDAPGPGAPAAPAPGADEITPVEVPAGSV